MIRLSRLADYGVVLMVQLASERSAVVTAHDLSAVSRLPLPTVSKLLSAMARAGLLEALRGAKGGYRLARAAEDITLADIVSAVEGPIALTQCLEFGPGHCEVERICPSQRGFRLVNDAVSKAFAAVTLAELVSPAAVLWGERQPEAMAGAGLAG
ncbi:MAG: SUF system Fe-S cluster assembly regulator [Rhodospirillales bacterium]|jgi:FeS assembly SUF system regulator|nr:SUF system Fe-S cluster assembly regulator [Rhodospirillales bacterium]